MSMKLGRKRQKNDSLWTRELIPEDSVWRRDLIPEGHILGRDLLSFAKKAPCLECPILMVEDEHKCNRFEHIPDEIWEGASICPLYREQGA